MEFKLRRNGADLDQSQFPEKPFLRSFAEVVLILNDSLFSGREEFKHNHSMRVTDGVEEKSVGSDEEGSEESEEKEKPDCVYFEDAHDPVLLGVLLLLEEDFTRLFATHLCCCNEADRNRVWNTYGIKFDMLGAQGKRTRFVISCHQRVHRFEETQTAYELNMMNFSCF